MAHVQNSAFDKALRHVRKKLLVSFRNMSPAALMRKKCRYPVLVNSIPKAGTHMLEEMLEVIPELCFSGKVTMACWDEATPGLLSQIGKMKKGYFSLAHLPALPEVLDVIDRSNTKVIYLIRDPRDVILSFANYVLHIDKTHMAHEYLASFDTEDQVIKAVIEGNRPGVANLGVLLNKFDQWGDAACAITCKYEDLLSPSRGGDRSRQVDTIHRILSHIEVDPTESLVESMLDRLDSDKSSTFNKGGANRWAGKFNQGHRDLVKAYAGDWLIKNGYEKNLEW